MSNGDLFRAVMAFSPGFVPSGAQKAGMPRIFVSHGTQDQILPIDQCSRRLVPEFKKAGYTVKFEEFDGPHTVPPEMARAAMTWFLK
jgi:phospholipase/carboxylesterase